jgi:hypothetical protein
MKALTGLTRKGLFDKIYIGGYGGEFVLGNITEEQHEYWTALGDDELETYCQDAFDYVDENRIPFIGFQLLFHPIDNKFWNAFFNEIRSIYKKQLREKRCSKA